MSLSKRNCLSLTKHQALNDREFHIKLRNYLTEKSLKVIENNINEEESKLQEYEFLADFALESLEKFIKGLEEQTVIASQNTEREIKLRREVNLECENVTNEINMIKAEIATVSEDLDDCKKYMEFLNNIGEEYVQQDQDKKEREMSGKRQMKEEVAHLIIEGKSLSEAQRIVQEKYHTAMNFVNSNIKGKSASELGEDTVIGLLKETGNFPSADKEFLSEFSLTNKKLNDPDDLPTEASEIHVEDLLENLNIAPGDETSDQKEIQSMAFQTPNQLLEVFQSMEVQVLTLLKNFPEENLSNQDEDPVEIYLGNLFKRQETIIKKIKEKEDQVNELEEHSKLNEQVIRLYNAETSNIKKQGKLLEVLDKHIADCFKTTFGGKIKFDSILMLTAIEKDYERMIRAIQDMPSEVVLKISNTLDKEHREAERDDRMKMRNIKQKLKTQKVVEKAHEDAPQNKGRAMNMRSKPPRKNPEISYNLFNKKAEEEEFNYFFTE